MKETSLWGNALGPGLGGEMSVGELSGWEQCLSVNMTKGICDPRGKKPRPANNYTFRNKLYNVDRSTNAVPN